MSCSGDSCHFDMSLANRARASTAPEEINQDRTLAVRASRQFHYLAPREPDRKEQKLLEFKIGIRKTRMEGFIDLTQTLARI